MIRARIPIARITRPTRPIHFAARSMRCCSTRLFAASWRLRMIRAGFIGLCPCESAGCGRRRRRSSRARRKSTLTGRTPAGSAEGCRYRASGISRQWRRGAGGSRRSRPRCSGAGSPAMRPRIRRAPARTSRLCHGANIRKAGDLPTETPPDRRRKFVVIEGGRQ